MKIYIIGVLGRMGQLVVKRLDSENGLHFIGGGDTESATINNIEININPEEIISAISKAEVVVDFSYPTGTDMAIDACIKNKISLVSGTTGLRPSQLEKIGELAASVPVVRAANFSIGITLLNELTRYASTFLPDAEIEIVEKHHRDKKDSPSGTALQLGKIISNAHQKDFSANVKYGRQGDNVQRGSEIGIHSVRGGSHIGQHDVHLFLKNETITLGHEALSREIFIDGVIKAIRFVAEKKQGLFTMRDVLGMRV